MSELHVEVSFDPASGRVLLDSERGQQVVFRISREGIHIWCKAEKREILLPWHQILGWVVTG